ncbi:MAG: DUF1028 domain-containing protein [Planctomycetota bacterium]|nr:MAG: DUF1028 domain-containing protein [Planctomycetota bacterium]
MARRPMSKVRTLFASAAALIAGAGAPASATWSVLIVDTRTGEIALGSATCLTRLDLRELTPVLITGVGAVTAQSSGDSTGRNRSFIRDRLLEGVPPEQLLELLADFDGNHQSRQYGIIDTRGGVATFTGSLAGPWAGGLTGQTGDLVYCVQGNVLSGGNVVQDAADAIVNTPGDLAEKLLAAMVAAREAGGDGRCSCDVRNPESCGSPPPAPFKSAHIGYMLVARAGDVDASRALYFAPTRPGFFAGTDLDGDGYTDIVASGLITTTLTLIHNRTMPGDPLSHVVVGEEIDVGVSGVRDLHAADATGDGVDDLLFIGATPGEVFMLPGLGGGAFGGLVSLALPGVPSYMDIADLDGDGRVEMIVTQAAAGRVEVVSGDGGVLSVTDSVDGLDGPTGIGIGDLNGDGRLDAIVAEGPADRVRVLLTQPDGTLNPAWTVAAGDQPVDADTGDLDADGDEDLVITNDEGATVMVLRNDGAGVFVLTQELTLFNDGKTVEVIDLNGDGSPDIASWASTNFALSVFTNDGSGVFTLTHENRAGAGQESVLLTDMNNDGLADFVSGSFQRGLTVMDNLGDGTFPPYEGFANGDYFLALNVPDTLANDPDPVDTMVADFAAWRQSLEGRIDAVRTEVLAPSRVPAGGVYTVRVTARDWRGDALVPGGLSVEAFALPGTGGEVVGTRVVSPGVVEIDLRADTNAGVDTTGVTLDDGTGPVRLMPDVGVVVLADFADFDGSGQRNFFDIAAFIDAYNAQDPAADLNTSGQSDPNDLLGYIDLFLAP